MLTVLRDDAVALCQGLGFPNARKWKKDRMTRKLKELVRTSDLEVDEEIVEDEEEQQKLNGLLEKIQTGNGEIDVVTTMPDVAVAEDQDGVTDEPEPDVEKKMDEKEEEETVEEEEEDSIPETEYPVEDKQDEVEAVVEEETVGESEGLPTKTEVVEKTTKRAKSAPKKPSRETVTLLDFLDAFSRAISVGLDSLVESISNQLGVETDVSVKEAVKAKVSKTSKPKASGERKLSLLNAAYQVLEAAGEPMRMGDMYDGVLKAGVWVPGEGKTPKVSLYGAINAEIKNKGEKSRFRKVGRGLFETT